MFPPENFHPNSWKSSMGSPNDELPLRRKRPERTASEEIAKAHQRYIEAEMLYTELLPGFELSVHTADVLLNSLSQDTIDPVLVSYAEQVEGVAAIEVAKITGAFETAKTEMKRLGQKVIENPIKDPLWPEETNTSRIIRQMNMTEVDLQRETFLQEAKQHGITLQNIDELRTEWLLNISDESHKQQVKSWFQHVFLALDHYEGEPRFNWPADYTILYQYKHPEDK